MKRATTIRLILLSSLLLVASFAHAQRGVAPEDTLRVAAVSDAQISPDASRVAYVVSTVSGNDTRSALWLARADDARRPVGALPGTEALSASHPRWSPDGRFVAFLGARGEQAGVWIVSPDGGGGAPRLVAPVRTTNFFITYAGEPFAWSADSRRIAYVSASEEQIVPDVADKSYQRERPEADPRVVDRLQYKSRTSFSDSLRTHVWVVDITSPQPKQLTFGQTYDHALTWSPRGDEVAFLSNHEPDPDANNNSDIFAVAVADGRVRQLTNTRGCEYEPAWSPDGRYIAYTATTREVTTIDSVAEDAHVWVLDTSNGNRRELTAAQDRRARSPQWSADGSMIYYLAGDHGRTTIYRVALAGDSGSRDRRIQALTLWDDPRGFTRSYFLSERQTLAEASGAPSLRPSQPFQITSFSVSAKPVYNATPGHDAGFGAPLAFTLTDADAPAELFEAEATGFLVRRLSAHNDQLVRGTQLSAPEEFTFESFDNTRVEGWLMKPLGWRSGGRYPLLLSVHGGPHGMYGYAFNPTFQAYCARGYAVLYINPRGSTGYGQKFSDGTLREWGGGDYKDLMAGVDYALRKYGWIDDARLGVTGGSYGGFMTNWIITQTTRFRAAVSVASVSNLVSFYATSLYQDLIHAEFGLPWDDYDLLWRWSPLRYVRDAQTPTLFIHGEQDNDVHITQAEEMYMALRRRGIDTVLLRYPREGHGFREPRHRVDALERTLGWFDKYLK
ncbi:MAG: S9 family peptidase [Acidobacteria bacterium]|nr:S9 family peptidase [Acidobacteriota bacterium]